MYLSTSGGLCSSLLRVGSDSIVLFHDIAYLLCSIGLCYAYMPVCDMIMFFMMFPCMRRFRFTTVFTGCFLGVIPVVTEFIESVSTS